MKWLRVAAIWTLLMSASAGAGEPRAVRGDPQQRYFLIGEDKDAPANGWALLVVLPGGDGGADFHPFVRRIHENALPPGYLVAQLIAVPAENPNAIVWPTEKTRDARQKFTAEEFVANVIKEIGATHRIDSKRTFALAWSSSGPAAYAIALAPETPVAGVFIAMSVFKPDRLPPLIRAKGRNFYLLQSPDDEVTRIAFAQAAMAQLVRNGANVTLAEYPGGHGWQGDVFGMIRAGVEWLEKQPATQPSTQRAG